MATVSSTLKMFDSFSGPLKNVTQALNITISTMEQLQSSADRNSNIARNFDVARDKIRSAEAELAKMANDINRAGREQQDFNRKLQQGGNFASNLVTKITGVVAAYMGINKIKNVATDLFSTGIDFHAFRQSSEVAFTTFFGDAEKAKQYMDDVLGFARTTPFAYPELLTAGRNMIAFGMEAEKTIPVLKAIGDATAGIGGNSQKLMEIADVFGQIQVSGRLALGEVNRFHTHGIPALKILANQAGITAEEMSKSITKGAVDANTAIAWLIDGIENGTDGIAGTTAKFGGMMEELKKTWAGTIDSFKSAKRNAGAEIMEGYMEPLREFIWTIIGFLKRLPSLIGPGIQAFTPLIQLISSAFETEKVDTFFIALNAGLQVAAWGMTLFTESALLLWDIFSTYWPVILAGLAVLSAIYLPTITTKLWLMIQPILAQAAAWAIAYWPITLVILAVVTLIAILYRFGVTTEQIIGFVVGYFYMMFASIWNQVALFWNYILAFAEFFANVFIDPVYAIKKLFFDMFKNVSDYFTNMVNNIIKGINWLIEKVNNIAGTSFNVIGEWSNEWLDNYKPTTDKDVVDLSKYRMDQMSFSDAFNKGYDKGSNFANGASEMLSGLQNVFDPNQLAADFGDTGLGPGKDINKVKKVGKIEDKVDISSEDLKIMRELAEMKSIQNFVTLTPTVEVTTGDINNGYDVDTVVRRIEQKLEEEFVASAKGVYN